jgi:chromate reductase, NAD(P)H dehydrogenase (quinone)
MPGAVRIAAISGSLREASYNTASLRAVAELASDTLTVDVITLEGIELFNEDVEARGWPPNVKALRDRVSPADGLIVATPEYNYGIPGVLKNALDWLSRPTGKGPIAGLPATIIGASPSTVGTARAQAHLRQVFFYNAIPLLPTAEVLIANAGDRFDEEGSLVHEPTRKFIAEMLRKFEPWVRQHGKNGGG